MRGTASRPYASYTSAGVYSCREAHSTIELPPAKSKRRRIGSRDSESVLQFPQACVVDCGVAGAPQDLIPLGGSILCEQDLHADAVAAANNLLSATRTRTCCMWGRSARDDAKKNRRANQNEERRHAFTLQLAGHLFAAAVSDVRLFGLV